MKLRFARLASLAALVLASIAAGCGGGSPMGGERQSCYPNGTCNTGLTCASNTCVDISGTGGRGGGTAGTTGTAGGNTGRGGAAGTGGSIGGAGTGGGAAGAGGTTGTGGTGGTTGAGGGSAGTTGAGGGSAGTTGAGGGTAGAGGGTAGTGGGAAGTTGSGGSTAGTTGTGGGTAGAGTAGTTGAGGGTGGTTGAAGTGGGTGAAGTGGSSACFTEADYGTIGMVTSPAATMFSTDIKWHLPLEASVPGDQLRVELFYNYGVFKPGAVKTGTYTLAGEELNYRTCGICVLIDENVSGNTLRGNYMATGGTVTLTSVSGKLTGQILNATFQHVNIDPDTLVSSPHPDGCTSAIKTLLFDVTITN